MSVNFDIGLHTVLSLTGDVVGLVGTKKACGQGGCGVCTVMVSRIDRQRKIQYPWLRVDVLYYFGIE